MKSITIAAAALMVSAGVAIAAPAQVPGIYTSAGIVTQDNGASSCSSVGLTKNSFVSSVLSYPGAGKTGLTLYTIPLPGVLQLCTGFAAVPAGGLNNFTSNASCQVTSTSGSIPAETVNFSFTATAANANSGVGTTTVTIPSLDPVGGGCTATISNTLVRSGK